MGLGVFLCLNDRSHGKKSPTKMSTLKMVWSDQIYGELLIRSMLNYKVWHLGSKNRKERSPTFLHNSVNEKLCCCSCILVCADEALHNVSIWLCEKCGCPLEHHRRFETTGYLLDLLQLSCAVQKNVAPELNITSSNSHRDRKEHMILPSTCTMGVRMI